MNRGEEFLGQDTQYRHDASSPQINLQIQHNPVKTSSAILYKLIDFKIPMRTQSLGKPKQL